MIESTHRTTSSAVLGLLVLLPELGISNVSVLISTHGSTDMTKSFKLWSPTCDFNFGRPLANSLRNGVGIGFHSSLVDLYGHIKDFPEGNVNIIAQGHLLSSSQFH